MKKQISYGLVSLLLSVGVTVVTAWLFFDFATASLWLVLYIPVAMFFRWKAYKRQMKWELNLAFKDALVCLENNMAVGYSPESSVKESVKNLEQLHGREHQICLEFRRMIKQMELGTSMEEVFLQFGNRSGVEDIKQLADVFSLVKRTGGNMGQVFRQTGSILQEKIDLKREVHTTMASKRAEFKIMLVVPYGILLYLKLCAPAMSERLYHNTFGVLFMWGVLVVYIGLQLLGEYIIQSETGKLEG